MGGSSRVTGPGTLVLFLVLAFAISWSVAGAMLLFRGQVEALAGPIDGHNPVFILAVWGPAIAAFIVVTLRHGLEGLGGFLRRLTLWRMHWGWWAFLVLAIPASRCAGVLLGGEPMPPFPFSPWHDVFPALLMTLIIGPVEEFGWRGFAQPLLQRWMAPFWATLVLGFIWAIWHYPAFIISGTPQDGGSFALFIVAAMVISLAFTALFNASRGSILIPALFHFQANNPALPDGGAGWLLALFVLVVVIVWLTRETMFRRGGGATELFLTRAEKP